MLAKWTLHFVAVAALVLGTGVGVGDDGPGGTSAGGSIFGKAAAGAGSAGKAPGAGVNFAAPAGGRQQVVDSIAVDPVAGTNERLREGTTLRLKGRFDLVGERATFYVEGGSASFKTLENLALQRVVEAVRDSTDSRLWNVEATVTEYQGANFLLIRRATVTLGE